MNAEPQLIDSGLRAWKFNADRIETFFHALSEDQLQQEIAPGRNRLLYLWGHLAAVNDGLFPLLGLGPKLHPELDAMFLANPDRTVTSVLSRSELKDATFITCENKPITASALPSATPAVTSGSSAASKEPKTRSNTTSAVIAPKPELLILDLLAAFA